MILKDTSVIPEFSSPILTANTIANEVASLQGANLTLTSGHRPGDPKKHGDLPSNAADYRRWNIAYPKEFCAELFTRLGEAGQDPYYDGEYWVWRGQQYDVLLGKKNIHVEYDPK